MKTVTLEFTNDVAKYLMYALRKRYGKDKRATMKRLCDLAIRTEIAAQAGEDLAEAEREIEKTYHRFLSGDEYVDSFTGEGVPPFLVFQPFVVRDGVAGYMVPCKPDHPEAEGE